MFISEIIIAVVGGLIVAAIIFKVRACSKVNSQRKNDNRLRKKIYAILKNPQYSSRCNGHRKTSHIADTLEVTHNKVFEICRDEENNNKIIWKLKPQS